MSAGVSLAGIVAAFDAVLAAPDPTSALTIQARRLRARLTSDLRIALLGMPGSGKTTLAGLLGQLAAAPAGQGLPRLSRVTVIDAPTGPNHEDLQAMCDRAVAGADILIWCTQHFGAVEQMVWRRVPEEKKDHAFLALTKADLLHRSGALMPRLAAIAEVTGEDFLGIYPLATPQAAAALATGPDLDAFRASGGRALAEEIARHVAQGRRSDIDHALMFLRKIGAEVPPARQEADPEADEAPARPVLSSAPSPAPITEPEPEVREGGDRLLGLAAQRLRGCGAALLDRTGTAAPRAEVLALCAETLEDLSDMVAAEEDAGHALGPLHEEILEAADMMLLMRLENGADAAEDAVTLLAQLEREIGAALAA